MLFYRGPDIATSSRFILSPPSLPTSYTVEMSTITMGKKSIAFLDTNSTVNEDGKVEVGVYRKATHTSKYLDFHSQSPAQNKRAVVKT